MFQELQLIEIVTAYRGPYKFLDFSSQHTITHADGWTNEWTDRRNIARSTYLNSLIKNIYLTASATPPSAGIL